MTLQDLIALLLDFDWTKTPRDVALTRAVLLAYELGLQHGKTETQAPPLEEGESHARALDGQ